MQQLRLMPEQLKRIGFRKQRFGTKNRYAIDIINGCFYYNEEDTNYTWYQRIKIRERYNYVDLNIGTLDDLFQLLTFFKIKFNFIKSHKY